MPGTNASARIRAEPLIGQARNYQKSEKTQRISADTLRSHVSCILPLRRLGCFMLHRKETTIERIYCEVPGNKMPAAVKRIVFAKRRTMPRARKLNLEKVRASLDAVCQKSGALIPFADLGPSTLKISGVRRAENDLRQTVNVENGLKNHRGGFAPRGVRYQLRVNRQLHNPRLALAQRSEEASTSRFVSRFDDEHF